MKINIAEKVIYNTIKILAFV